MSAQLVGSGAGPQVSADPGSVDFGSVPLTDSVTRDVTLSNTGTVPVSPFFYEVVAGSGGAFTTVATTCPAILIVAATCRVTLRFAPTAIGPSTAAFTAHVTAPGGSDVIATASASFSGVGVELPPARAGAGSAGGGYVLVAPQNVEANRVRFEWALRVWRAGVSGKQLTLRFRSAGVSYVLRTASIDSLFLWGPTGKEHARFSGIAALATIDTFGAEQPLAGPYGVTVDAEDLSTPGRGVDTFAATIIGPDQAVFFQVGPLSIAGPTSEIGNRTR